MDWKRLPGGGDGALMRRRKSRWDRSEEERLKRALESANDELTAIYSSRGWKVLMRAAAWVAKARAFRRRWAPWCPPPSKVAKWVARARAGLRTNFVPSFQRDSGPLSFPSFERPEVSVILPVFNQWNYTRTCLESLLKNVKGVSYEVILADDASQDGTREAGRWVTGMRILRNRRNLGFARNCNRAAAQAKGRYLLFLDNDTVLRAGAVEALVHTIRGGRRVGAVGGKVLSPNGQLLEAGSLVWRDGTCLGYGRGDCPGKPEYSFVRRVDYCAGGFLMTRRDLFARLGGFSRSYAPAYYEDTDLCLRLGEAGWKVLYQPQAEIVHYESISCGKAGAIERQKKLRKVFARRWAHRLRRHLPAGERNVLRAREAGSSRKVLWIDDRIPNPRLGVGLPRAFCMLQSLVKAGCSVTMFPLQNPSRDEEVLGELQQSGVELFYGRTDRRLDFEAFFRERAGFYDAVLISRPHNMDQTIRVIRRLDPGIRVVYDAEALFALREICYRRIVGRPLSRGDARRKLEEEASLTAEADGVLTVSEAERDLLAGLGANNVHVVSHPVMTAPTPRVFEERSGLLFVGSVLSADEANPNFDAVRFLCRQIWPRVSERVEGDLHVVGTNQTKELAEYGNARVRIVGRVENLDGWYDRCRVFVAPTRFAAGIPVKVLEASSRGIPCVVSDLLARQLCWTSGQECLAASSPAAFAEGIARLYRDKKLWERLRRNSLVNLRRRFRPEVFDRELWKTVGLSKTSRAI